MRVKTRTGRGVHLLFSLLSDKQSGNFEINNNMKKEKKKQVSVHL